tara:strand:+ start:122 stop:280 length:159 start_codon:yes stop_codon:yes gene_type:complete
MENDKIKAVLCTCLNGTVEREEIELPANYDGNPYGDTVPFSIGSNQYIELED